MINKKYNPLRKYAKAPKNGLFINKKSPANKLLNSTKANTKATNEAIAKPKYTKTALRILILQTLLKESFHIAFIDKVIKNDTTVMIFCYFFINPWVDIISCTWSVARWESIRAIST